MVLSNQQPLTIFLQGYQPLLYRYALRIVKNRLAAALVVEEVFIRLGEQSGIIIPGNMRSYLKESTRECCRQWLGSKNRTLYLRKPKNPT